MLLQVVAVKDAAVNAFTQSVTLVHHTGAAVREFTNACNEPGHAFCVSAKDYDLYLLGTFDNQTGQFESLAQPERLVRGSDAKASVN